MRLVFLICVTVCAFALNSILTRLGIDGGHIDPNSFALIRVGSGAAVLVGIALLRRRPLGLVKRSRLAGAVSLVIYMIGFTLAYTTLDAGLGALILFGVVQLAMFTQAILTGAPPTRQQLLGASLAFTGLLAAFWPAPSAQVEVAGFLLMGLAGLGWASYTITGRGSADPLGDTAASFVWAAGLMIPVMLWYVTDASPTGWVIALTCGAITSALGYALWYSVLPSLTPSIAAIVQLSVPAVAIVGGTVLLGEPLTARVLIAAGLVLSGIALAVTSRSSRAGRS